MAWEGLTAADPLPAVQNGGRRSWQRAERCKEDHCDCSDRDRAGLSESESVFVGWLFFHGESAASGIRSKRTLSELDFASPRASGLNRPNQCPPPPPPSRLARPAEGDSEG